jgi:hypothetical protein
MTRAQLLAVSLIVAAGAVSPVRADEPPAVASPPVEPAAELDHEQKQSVAQLAVRYATLVAVPVGTLVYGQKIWDWGSSPGWRWGNEGWFGLESPHGGVDKLGHAFGHYVLTRVSARIFGWTENGAPRARLLYAGGMAFAIGAGIEIGDAFNGAYGFSFQDLAADSTGVLLGVLLELSPRASELVGVSMQYWPTRGFRESGEPWLAFEGDSSGFLYMVNLRPAGLRGFGLNVPAYLSLATLDAGYFSRGFTKFDRAMGDAHRARSLFVGMSLDAREIVDLAFRRRPYVASRVLRETFGYFHLPLGITRAASLD